jgi:hypothetical protein
MIQLRFFPIFHGDLKVFFKLKIEKIFFFFWYFMGFFVTCKGVAQDGTNPTLTQVVVVTTTVDVTSGSGTLTFNFTISDLGKNFDRITAFFANEGLGAHFYF